MLSMGEANADAYLKRLAAQNVVGFTAQRSGPDRSRHCRRVRNHTDHRAAPPDHRGDQGRPSPRKSMQPMPSTRRQHHDPKGHQASARCDAVVDYVALGGRPDGVARRAIFPVNEDVEPLKVLQPVSRASRLEGNLHGRRNDYNTHDKVRRAAEETLR
jgi:hypothetical protein